jgi:hypothetical protein
LIGPYGSLRLGRIDAIDGAEVKAEVFQMCLGDLDIPSCQEPVHRVAYSPGLVPTCVRHDAGSEQHHGPR